MSTIVTRAGKGAPLSNTEMDSNFTNLNSDKLQIGSGSTSSVANRVPYYNSSNLLAISTSFTFDGTTLSTAGLSDSGNLTFTGTGNRITGDFSNATVANQVIFQSSTTNGNTSIYHIPNGTGTSTSLVASNSSDLSGTSTGVIAFLQANSTDARVTSGRLSASATYLPLTMWTGGSERLRIDTSGNVGIGTASPTSKLSFGANIGLDFAVFENPGGANKYGIGMSGAGTGGDPYRTKIYANGVEYLSITASGNIGIGTSSPDYKFTVVNSGATSGVIAGFGTNGVENLLTLSYDTTLGESKFEGSQYGATCLSAPSTNAITFKTNATERMRIDSSGNVGIGVSNPSSYGILTAYAASNPTLTIASGNSNAYLRLNTTSDANMYLTNTGGSMTMNTANTERMRIDSSGNVGIAITTPDNKLCVGDGTADTRAVFRSSTPYAVGISNGSGFAGWIGGSGATDNMVFSSAGGFERMRIDSSGNVLVGASAASNPARIISKTAFAAPTGVAVNYGQLYLASTDAVAADKGGVLSFGGNYDASPTDTRWAVIAGLKEDATSGNYGGYLSFYTRPNGSAPAERMRITSGGNAFIGTTTGIWGERILGYQAGDAVVQGLYSFSSSYTSSVLRLQTETGGGTSWQLINGRRNGGADVFVVYGNGNVTNSNNSYGAISDVKLKENIVDATPKLEDLCKVKVRQYNLKSDPDHKQIGVVAQELEEVFAGLVEEVDDKDDEGKDLGTTTKQVKYSVFVPMLIKAVQELKAEVDSLKQQLGK